MEGYVLRSRGDPPPSVEEDQTQTDERPSWTPHHCINITGLYSCIFNVGHCQRKYMLTRLN